MDVLFARNQKKTLVEPVTCTCPFRAACWHGDVCGTQATITDRPGCFRPLDGTAPVVAERQPVRPMPPMTEGTDEPGTVTIEVQPPPMKIKAVAYRFDWDGKDDASSPVTPQKAVMIQGVLF